MDPSAAETRPTLFCLHFLGGSGREWSEVAAHLAGRVACVAIDLPGFGDAAGTEGYGVGEMAGRVAGVIAERAPGQWLLAGHSMGAKVAAAVARRAEDGDASLAGLAGLVLLAGSPPAPEPMDEARRAEMLGWFAGDAATSRRQAQQFVGANVSAALDDARHGEVVEEVLRAHPEAWRAWLRDGSNEDWRGRIGVLQTPALILAGADDEDLGPAAQRRLMAPHFARCRVEVVPGAKHLLPLEQPAVVARLILEHVAGVVDGQV